MTGIIILALATATASVTVAQSKAFKWLRDWTKDVPALGDLLSCSYCLGHWVAGGLVLLCWHNAAWLDLGVWWLAVTALAALISGAIGRLHGD